MLIERRGEVNGINLGWVETNPFVFWYQWDYLRSPAKNWTFCQWVSKIGHEIWKGTQWCPIPSEVGLWLLELWTLWWFWLKLMRFLHQLLNMLKLGFVTIGTPHCGMWIRSCIGDPRIPGMKSGCLWEWKVPQTGEFKKQHKDRLAAFWQTNSSHPAFQARGLAERPDYRRRCVPLSLHGDDVPVVGVGKSWCSLLTVFSWSSQCGFGNTKEAQYLYGGAGTSYARSRRTSL